MRPSGEAPRRRDFLRLAGLSMLGIGGAAALWPLLASMRPAADARREGVRLDLATLGPTGATVMLRGTLPVLVFRRTLAQLAALRDPDASHRPRPAMAESRAAPAYARNWHRSIRPELMVLTALCTHDHCLVRRNEAGWPEGEGFHCPCCGSRYDLAGRVLLGVARDDLAVPTYRYLRDGMIEIREEPGGLLAS